MFLYVAQAGDSGVLKIGRAVNPKRRLGSLQTGAVDRLTLAHLVPVDPATGGQIEKFAHWLLKDCWISGEWFRMTLADGVTAIAHAVEAVGRGEKPGRPALVPGPPKQDLEDILGRYPRGTKERIARVLGPDAGKGAQAELLRQALERELKRRERQR